MTVDIHFGKLTQDEDGDWRALWEPEPFEDDGCSKEHTIFAGRPRRSFSNSGFADWTERNPIAFAVATLCWKDDRQVTKLDDTLIALFEALALGGSSRGDRDRARWFVYWAKRARAEFGPEAAVYFW